MKLQRIPFAFAALALSHALPLGSQTASVTIEAESMTRSSYAVEGSLIKVSSANATGTATKPFAGASGTYDIQVQVMLENDGRPTLELFKGATKLHTYTYALGSSAASFTVSNVKLNNGELIKLVGHPNGSAYARVDKIVFTPTSTSSNPAPGSGAYAGTPYTGTPVKLPKAFQAVNFDKGGQGVAYNDLTPGNIGKLYRTSEDVDIATSPDAEGGPYRINNIQLGEWLSYTVEAPAEGNYDLAIRAASDQATPAAFRIEVDGVNATGSLSVPNTGSWTAFQWVGKQGVKLTKGKHVLKVVAETPYFNMNAVSVLASAAAAPSPAPGGTASPLTIEAETMALSSYAQEGNLIKLTSSSGSATKGFSGASGTYNMQVHVLPENDGRPTLELHKGSTRLQTYTYPSGTSLTSFTVNNVPLTQGEPIKLVGRADGGAWARVDKIVLTPVSGGGTTPPLPEPTSPPPASPLTIEAETMALSSYAQEGNLIKLTSSSGSATKGFSGASGTYNMQVHVLPENDGRPTLELHKGSTRLQTYTYPSGTSLTSFTVNNVPLTQGEPIKLVGRADGGAWARVDKIVLTPVSGGGTTPPLPEPTSPPPTSPPPATTSACANPSGGYEGFGRNTTGGAGKSVYRVTSLGDSGAGSLRDALSQGNRCVVFDVGGTISLSSDLIVKGANVTIDGFTAPSPGITLKNRTLVMQGSSGASNVVVRGIRHRGTSSGLDGIRVYGASNIVIDRVSVSGFGDGAIDVTEKSRDVTIQWSIVGSGLTSSPAASLIKYETTRVSVHHNLYINNGDRHPHCGRSDTAKSQMAEIVCDVRNNLIWNYRYYGTRIRTYATANVVNNYYYTTSSAGASNTIYMDSGTGAYVSGNYSGNGWNLNGLGNRSTPYAAVAPTTTDAVTAAHQVLANAGARGPKFGLDSADQGYVKQVSIQSQ